MEKIIRRNSLLRLVSELEKHRSENQDMLSAYITPESDLISEMPEKIRAIASKTLKKSLGIVVFHREEDEERIVSMIICSPLPLIKDEISYGKRFELGQLRAILTTDYTLGIILVRLGEYAVGVFKGNRLVSSKCGKRLVRARHKKGGFSQKRFARIRDMQMNQFFDELYKVLRSKLTPHLDEIDYIIYGGPKLTIKKFLKRNHFIKKLNEKTLSRTLDVRRVNKKALENILFEMWKSRVLYL